MSNKLKGKVLNIWTLPKKRKVQQKKFKMSVDENKSQD